MKEERLFKIYYGENENDYIMRQLKESDIINGYLSEAKAFDVFYSDMIICNDYLKNNYNDIEILTNYEDDEYIEEYQTFIINIEYNEETTRQATEKMGNTLYYDTKLDLYLTGITDLGTSRTIVPTDLKVEEV